MATTDSAVLRVGLAGRTMPWLNSFQVGDRLIDDEHRHLIEACNDLCRLAENGVEIRAVAEDLIGIVDEHFTSEEALFQRIDFPGEAPHAAEHETIRATMRELLLSGERSDKPQAAAIIRMMIVDHIVRHDLAFKTFVLDAAGM